MNITLIVISIIALAVIFAADFYIKKHNRVAAASRERQDREQLLNDMPQRIFDTTHKCAKYLRVPPERVLDLTEPMEIEAPKPPGCGRYIPTNVMITQHLQGAVRTLCDAKAAFLINDLFLADALLLKIETSLQSALRGQQLRNIEAIAEEETQQALQALRK